MSREIPQTILVVPCFNEEQRLPVQDFLAFLATGPAEVSFLLVDDGSRDGTRQVLEGLGQAHPERVKLLPLQANRGKAEAVRQGVLAALEMTPEFIGYWDADLAAPLEEAAALLDILRDKPEVDMVLGSRVQMLGRRISRRPLRHYLGRVSATLISLLLHLPIYDSQCGAKIFQVNQRLRQIFAQPFQARWLFDVEIILRYLALWKQEPRPASWQRIYEQPLSCWRDIGGSKVGPGGYLRSLADYGRLWRHY